LWFPNIDQPFHQDYPASQEQTMTGFVNKEVQKSGKMLQEQFGK
jgi:hypothetical protein